MSTDENPVARQRHGEVDNFTCTEQNHRSEIPLDAQAVIAILIPIVISVVLLAVFGARQ
jgi:hypothetical protein